MSVSVSTTNKPLNPRAQDLSPKGYNRAALYSGKALDFDGVNDYVDCGTLDVTAYTAISISLNLKLANTTDILRFVSLQHTSIDDLRIVQNGDTIFFTLDDGTAYNVETPTLTANEWNKLDMTFDGTTLKGYVNGISIGSITASFDFSTASGLLTLFKHSAATQYAEGSMSGFKIFNTALTAAQVADLYLNPEKIVPDGVADSALKLWLPMMEGAGSTAYDGSGNGNHGTISGATWVSGIGAPVAQTALVSWNKGTNLALYSEDLIDWGDVNGTSTSNQTISPDGTQNADKFTPTDLGANTRTYFAITTGATYTMSVYLKKAGIDEVQVDLSNTYFSDAYVTVNLTSGTITGTGGDNISQNITSVGNEWYLVSFTALSIATAGSSPLIIRNNLGFDGSSGFYVWGAFVTQSSSVQPYIPTLATAQTSPVLLPQGLTANKDITGVNAFESARNPYALNLDGASWGEVHDNASLDFGTGDFTLESWARLQYINTGSSINSILSIGTSAALTMIGTNSPSSIVALVDGAGVYESITIGDWGHIILTKEGTSCKLYVNGVNTDTFTKAADVTNTDNKYLGADVTTIRYYKDQIALPRIYNRALTATEVARNYNADKSKFGL